MSIIATTVQSAFYTAVVQAWKISTLTPTRQKLALASIVGFGVFAFFIFGAILFTLIFIKLFPPSELQSARNERRAVRTAFRATSASIDHSIDNSESNAGIKELKSNGDNTSNTFMHTTDFVGGFAVLVVTILQGIASAGITFATILVPFAIPLLSLVFLFTVTLVFAFQTAPIMSFVHQVNVAFIRPVSDYAINLVLALLLIVYQAVYPFYVNINRGLRLLVVGPGLALIQCALPNVPQYMRDLGSITVNFASMLAYWFSNNPFFTEIPMVEFVQAVGTLVSDIYTHVISCSCTMLDFIIGGIGKALRLTTFAQGINSATNLGLELIMEPILRPIVALQAPSITRSFNLSVATAVGIGSWVQNVTTYQFDIWIFDGNETLVNMVDGSQPPPTDDLIYLVRFLRAQWATGTLRALNWLLLFVFWEPLRIAFNIRQVFTASGASVFTFDWTRGETLAVIDAAGTLIDVLPQCDNRPTFNDTVPFSNLMSLPRAAVWLIQIVVDVIVGELYTAFYPPHEVIGFFLEQYLFTKGIAMQSFDSEVRKIGLAFGCTLAYLDKSIGISFDGLIEAVVIYVPRIPFELLAALRYILEKGDVTVLDGIDVTPFENALLQTARVGEVFYQFELGANTTTCPGRVTFFCSAGLFVEKLLSSAFRAITVALRLIIHLIKVVVSGITIGTLGNIVAPDFTPLMDDLYAAACRLGTMLGTIIPMQVPCMTSQLGFCEVKEFPQQVDSTLNVCLGTFLCKVGNLIVVILDIYFTLLHYVISFDFANTSLLVSAVKAVFNIIIFRIMSPICPFGHFMDCLFDAMLGSASTSDPAPASAFFCLITGAAVYLVQTVGEIIISWLNWFIQLIVLILNPGGAGDTAQAIVSLITTFIQNIGTTVGKLILAVINLALSFFFSIIVGICYLINIPLFFILTTQCKNLNDSLQNILGGSGLGFNSPSYVNYKRDINTGFERCQLYDAQQFTNNLFSILDNDFPDLLNGQPKKRSYINTCRKRAIDATSVIELALANAYGSGPSDPQEMPNYMATQVYWEPSSTCYMLMQEISTLNTSDLGPAERVQFAECIRLKTLAIVLAATFQPLSWLPEDIFYNPWLRVSILAIQLARFATVAIQWIMDHTLPPAMVMSTTYQQDWQTRYNLDISHYPLLTLAALPDTASNLSPAAIIRVTLALQNLTLSTYLQRNFPAYYAYNTTLGSDPLLDPFYSMYNFTYGFAMNTAFGIYNQSVTVSSFNTSTVYFYGHDLYNRTELLVEYGPYVVSMVDTRMSSHGLFEILSNFISNVFSGLHAFGVASGYIAPTTITPTPYTAAGTGLYSFGKRSLLAANVLLNTSAATALNFTQTHTQSRLEALYASPAFQKQPSLFAGIIATTADLLANSINAQAKNVVTPWCVHKAVRMMNLTYEAARQRLTPQMCADIMAQNVSSDNSTSETLLWRIFKPRHPGAIQKWENIGKFRDTLITKMWSSAYVFVGTGGTVVSRFDKVMKNTHPSWQDHITEMRSNKFQSKRVATTPGSSNETWLNYQTWRKQNDRLFVDLQHQLQTVVAEEIRVRDELEWRFDYYHPLRERVLSRHKIQANSRVVAADFSLAPIFNNSLLLERECGTDQAWLCKECYVVDRFIGLIIDRVLGFINYMTGYFVQVLLDLSAFIQYTLDDNAVVQLGQSRTFPPRVPALGRNTGDFLHLTPNETNVGLSYTLWLETIFNGTLPSLYVGGPCAQSVYNYTASRNLATSNGTAFVLSPQMEILAFVQITLGWDVCALIDTVTTISVDRVESTALYIAEHLVRCHYSYEIDCSQQQYSFVGGWLVTFAWVGGAMVVTMLALQPTPLGPMTMLFVMSGFLLVMPFFHAIITYQWSTWCAFIPPQCYLKDAWDVYAFSINGKCSPIIGAFVRNNTWDLNTCKQSNLTWEFADCQQLGFRNFIDVLTFWKLWFGTDLGLIAILQPIMNVFGSTTPTTDFAGWDTDPALHSNYFACSMTMTIAAALATAVLAIIAAALVIAFLPSLLNLLLGVAIFFTNAMRFTAYGIEEIVKSTETQL